MNYIQITNSSELAEHLNKASTFINSGTKYRAITLDEVDIVTNVPVEFYSHTDVKEYCPPTVTDRYNDNHFISFLQQAFNFGHQQQEMFRYNECHDNALNVYFNILNLAKANDLPISSPASICFGYIAKSLSPNAQIGNAVTASDSFIVHDWHIWNKVNKFIIDLSVTKNGCNAELGTNIEQRKWQKAEDHVFMQTPPNATYFGLDFVDPVEFRNFVNKLFNYHQ